MLATIKMPGSPLIERPAVLEFTFQMNVLLCQKILMNVFTKTIFTVYIVIVSSSFYSCVETLL